MAMPERIRVAFSDGPSDATVLDLGSKRFWAAALVFGAFFLIFAWIALSQIGLIGGSGIETVFDLSFVLFEAFWVLGWSVGVAVLFLITVFLLFYDESARLTPTRLVHVPRLGPVRIFMEYDLTRIQNLRLADGRAREEATIRFDYGDRTVNLGNGIPRRDAREIVAAVNEASEQAVRGTAEGATKGGKGSRREGGGSRSAPAVSSSGVGWIAPGFDITGWVRRRVQARTRTSVEEAPDWTSPSVLALLLANLVPLIGVVVLGWDLGEIMVLFWAESGIIGLYSLLRLCYVAGWTAIVLGPFFLAHFGGFMAGHFLFIYAFFIQGVDSDGTVAAGAESDVLATLGDIFVPLFPALLALFLSHGVSFFTNFLQRREYVGRDPSDQMKEPYKRVVVMHLTIIFGGWLILGLGTPGWALVLLLVLKTVVDLSAHRKEHANAGGTPEGAVTLAG